ncbi:MAG: ankyrin repeat domain-containing protein [Alphaproteobacteria bacterium]|nr:MAG: ankyrin repeat domain-containing protein [Alphaproteobacteria bacterium]
MPLQQDFNNASVGTAAELAAAVAAGNFKAVRKGLEFGIRPDACDAAGNSALLLAIQGRNLPLAGMLLGYGAPVNDEKLLGTALTQDSDEMADLLLTFGADPLPHAAGHSRHLILRAAARGVDKAVKDLLGSGVDKGMMDDKGASLLMLAAEGGHANVVDTMLKAGLDVHQCDKKGRSPLRAAMQGGSLDCVNLLLAAGADPGIRSDFKDVSITDDDFSKKCDPSIAIVVDAAYQKFLLNDAAKHGDAEKVAELLAKGEPADTFNHSGATPLYYACLKGNAKILRLLLDHHADPNLRDKKGHLPLEYVIDRGNAEMTEMMIAAGAIPSPASLHAACGRKFPDVVKVLLRHGANPNITARETRHFPNASDTGISEALRVLPDDYPLHTAIKNGDLETVEALVAAEASTVVRNAAEETPLQLARNSASKAILKCVELRHDAEMEAMGQSAVRLDQQMGAMKTLRFKPKAGPS